MVFFPLSHEQDWGKKLIPKKVKRYISIFATTKITTSYSTPLSYRPDPTPIKLQLL